MFTKNMEIGVLFDFYGDILPERKRFVIDSYYNEDLSLAEIADELGISRQGVRDAIKKAEADLIFYEEKLGLAAKFGAIRQAAEELSDATGKEGVSDSLRQKIDTVVSLATL